MQKIWKILFSFAFLLSLFLNFEVARPVSVNHSDIKLPIIMYHKISESKGSWGKYSISPEEFESDVKTLLTRGFTPITISDLIAYTNGAGTLPQKPVMLSFDDGNHSDFLYAFPIAQKYKVKIICSPVGKYTEDYSSSTDHTYLSWSEMQEMEKSGFVEFQNHSYNLHNFNSTRKGALKSDSESDEEYRALILNDLSRAQALFKENGLNVPTCFTFPYGMRDDRLANYVKEAGFSVSLGTYSRINLLGDSLFDLCRFNRPHNYDIEKILDLAE